MTDHEIAKVRLQRMIEKFNKSNVTNDTSMLNNNTDKKVAKYRGPYLIPSRLNSTSVDKFRNSLSSTR